MLAHTPDHLLELQVALFHIFICVYNIPIGAPLDAIDFDGHTPMHVAAINSVALPICKLLVEKTMPHIDRTTITTSKTALHYAAMQGFADLVELLLVNQAKINIADLTGKTPESYAKAGLEEAMADKAAKKLPKNAANAKIQRYRMSLQHLHKAMATIREAQIRRDAQLEEQRRKEEALAREEEEKDKAARRKQEEKLEADMRRQQEQEKELERLKAMAAANANGQNSGGGGKKKKKKKGKGGDQQQQQQQKQQPAPTSITISSPALSMSSSSPSLSIGSPAIVANIVTTPSKSTPLPQSQQPLSAPQKNISSAGPTPTVTGPVSSSVRSATETSSSKTNPTTAPTSILTPSQPSRLPKIKTSYRPSALVVTRMVDMGFPSRVSRKALIMTEGRVEEAIDLLTSGAPLADDSEDETERKAEALRLKAAKKLAPAPVSVEQKKQEPQAEENIGRSDMALRSEAPGISAPSEKSPTTISVSTPFNVPAPIPAPVPAPALASTPKPQPVLPSSIRSSSQKPLTKASPSSTAGYVNAYRSAGYPVQILQRTHPMAAHVQMRSVPTQVLQHAQPSGTSTTSRKSFSGEGRSAPSQPLAQKAPFVAPPPVHHQPPTRAPYSYGAKPVPSQSTDATQDSLVSPTASTPAQPTQSETGVGSGYVLLKDIMDDIGSVESYGSASPYPGTQSTEYTGYDERASWTASTSNLGTPSGIGMGGSYPVPTPSGNLWAATESRTDFGFGATDMGMSALPSTFASNLSMSGSKPNLSAIGSTRSGGMLVGAQDYNPEMEHPDADIIKDVLAMTGAIDSDDFVDGLDNEYSFKRSIPADTLSSAVPSRAVGGGRAQSHPTSSLWSGDAFGGLISPISQSFSSSRLGGDSGSGDGMLCISLERDLEGLHLNCALTIVFFLYCK